MAYFIVAAVTVVAVELIFGTPCVLVPGIVEVESGISRL